MPVLKIKNNGVWEQVSGIPDHTHVIDDITDFPTSLPANGGNADTVDGKHASDFASAAEMTTVQNDINDINTVLNGIEIPTALPNPNALTFTGAAEGTYDGSEPLTVEIPSGDSIVPAPSFADNGKHLVCENGAAAWMQVEASGGGATEDTWELIDAVDCTSGDIALIEIALTKLYKAILVTNCAFEKNWSDMSYDNAILTGTSQIDCDLKLKDSYNLNVNLDTNGDTKRKQKFVIQRTGRTEYGYLFTITSETGAFTSGGVNQGTVKRTIWHSIRGKSFESIKLKPLKPNVYFNNIIWVYGIPE